MTTLIIPMAGAGSRFAAAGFTDPKPFIRVEGEPLWKRAVMDAASVLGEMPWRVILLAREEHVDRLRQEAHDRWLTSHVVIVPVPALTDGAATTVQLAESVIQDIGEDVLVSNCDQHVVVSEATRATFKAIRDEGCADAIVLGFRATESKWSYLYQQQIVEKPAVAPKGGMATCGLYWFASAGNMFDAIKLMKYRNDRVNGEFYFAPCLNHLYVYRDNRSPIVPLYVDEMYGLGTPEDLNAYLDRS